MANGYLKPKLCGRSENFVSVRGREKARSPSAVALTLRTSSKFQLIFRLAGGTQRFFALDCILGAPFVLQRSHTEKLASAAAPRSPFWITRLQNAQTIRK